MKILKIVILYVLFLFAMVLCGTVVMKVFDVIFQLGYENIWAVGYKAGFVSWLCLSIVSFVNKTRKKNTTEENSEN
ncbi:MAG: hypothetical protein E7291_01305 [Lachnospiraceae bacterium]|nr:hypothetical protein [Lachnospiraceae bacterium]